MRNLLNTTKHLLNHLHPFGVCKDLIHLITRWHQRWTNTSIQNIFQSMVSIIVYYNEIELTGVISHILILSNGIPPLCFYYALIHKYPTSSISSNSTLEVYACMVLIYTYTHRHLCSQVRSPSPHQLLIHLKRLQNNYFKLQSFHFQRKKRFVRFFSRFSSTFQLNIC